MLHIYTVTPPIAATQTIPNGGVAAAPNGSGASCPMERPSASLAALEAGSRRNETPARRKLKPTPLVSSRRSHVVRPFKMRFACSWRTKRLVG